MTSARGSTFIAAKYWDSFAADCALIAIPIVIGENVVGVDRASSMANGRIAKSPELDRRIEIYNRYSDGYGTMLIQLNVEDTRNGPAEYVIGKYDYKKGTSLVAKSLARDRRKTMQGMKLWEKRKKAVKTPA